MNRADIMERWHTAVAPLRRSASPRPRLSRWAWAGDALLALFLAASTVNSVSSNVYVDPLLPSAEPPLVPKLPDLPGLLGGRALHDGLALSHDWGVALGSLTALPLALRRRYPLSVFWTVLVASLAFHTDVHVNDTAIFTLISCLIAAYSAAVYSPYRTATVASIAVGALLIALLHSDNMPNVTPGFVPFLLLLPIGLAANGIHTWKQRVVALEEEQEAATLQAVDRERARIARELHDVVTHNVSVMVVQAGAARKVMDQAPEQAKEALLAVESGGRAAMAELRHVMGLLTMKAGDGPDSALRVDLAPQPGLDQVGALADRIRDTGVDVRLEITGAAVPLPPGVDLAAYRVVQEALTNTVKHASGSSVLIKVEYGRDAVRIEVADTGGTSVATADTGNGRGLIGLRERLAVYRGTLQAGPRFGGGYRVRAVIPVEEP